jgi:cephalosporin hydroxylase
MQDYMPLLREVTRTRPGARVIELGTRTGNSTLSLLTGALQSGGHVWSVDPDLCDQDPDGMGPWADDRHWTFIRGDDQDPAVLAQLPRKCDVLFVDTSHHYDHTLNELGLYLPRVVPGGIALFHDTLLQGIENYQWDKPLSPVWTALDDHCRQAGLSWANVPGQFGLGIIQL